jgi:thioredoxin-like negative regulator of GroEL
MTDVAWLLGALLIATLAFGLWRRSRDGRMTSTADVPGDGAWSAAASISEQDVQHPLGATATFVQFSSAFCQPCRATRVLLETVVADRPGVVHIEIDAESHLELVRRFDVMRTPTVLVLDAAGFIRGRASGVPRRDQILRTLDSLTSGTAG